MSDSSIIFSLYEIGAIQFGNFQLKSGMFSPIYLDLRLIVSFPDLLKKVAHAIWEKISLLSFDLICGVPYTALPIATAISLEHNIPMILRRKEAKDYGRKRMIEGVFERGQTCLVVEDLVTSGSSVIETICPLSEEGIRVADAVVLIDREQGGRARLEKSGCALHAVFTLSEILYILQDRKYLDAEIVHSVKTFISQNQTIGA